MKKQKTKREISPTSSVSRSIDRSNRSQRSNKSQQKKVTSRVNPKNNNTVNYLKKNMNILSSRRKSSVYDSDTESSRMRKNNNRVSPYRQPASPAKRVSTRNSQKKNYNQNISTSNYQNYQPQNRKRSRSREIERESQYSASQVF